MEWLKFGDQNTRFFHERAKTRTRTNTIHSVLDDQNVWQTDPKVIGALFCGYFSGLFTSSGGLCMDHILRFIDPCISDDMNSKLMRPFTREELEKTLFKMPPTKSPGVDGMNAIFFQKFWHVVGDDVSSVCLLILNGDQSVKPFNHTLLTLIPKIKNPSFVSDFRPISLCTVIYKLVAKTFANRLKLVLPSVISPTQSAFVPRRNIHDNVMIGFELMHYLKRLNPDDLWCIALKLDMAKAYHRVE